LHQLITLDKHLAQSQIITMGRAFSAVPDYYDGTSI